MKKDPPADAPEGPPNPFRAWREAKQMKLTELALAMGKTRNATGNLSKLERGLIGYSGDLLSTLSGIYGITNAQLLAGPGPEDYPPPDGADAPAAAAPGPAALELSANKAESINADEAHILSCYRRMSASSRRYIYLLCGDLYLLGDKAPDPFGMRGLVNILPVEAGGDAHENAKSHPVSASQG